MPYVYTLLILLGVATISALIYIGVYFLFSKKKKLTKKDIILSYIKESRKTGKNEQCNCDNCSIGCEEFVDKYLAGEMRISDCSSIDLFERDAIERIAGDRRSVDVEKVAFVFCKGGSRAKKAYNYLGVNTCASQKELFGGGLLCKSGCLGCMDCERVCPTGAIRKNRFGVAEVDRSKCIGCGECVKVCPNDVIGLIPLTQEVSIVCNVNSERLGNRVSEICSVGCTHCLKCVKACKYDAIRVKNGYVEIDESKCVKCFECVYACPNHTISKLIKDI